MNGGQERSDPGSGTNTEELQQRWSTVMMNNYGTPPVALASGDGAVVTDVDGKSYSTCSAASPSTFSATAIPPSSKR